MKKLQENQNKMLSALYSKSQILAMALYFFGTIDDAEFTVIENIIRRKMGLSVGVPAIDKPLHESIEELHNHIRIEEMEGDEGKTIYSYTTRYNTGIDLYNDRKKREQESTEAPSPSFGALGQVVPRTLYDVMNEIAKDSIEIMVRRASLNSAFPRIRTNAQISDYNFTKGEGLIEDTEYRLTREGLFHLKTDAELENANKAIAEFNENKTRSDHLNYLIEKKYATVGKFSVTKRGRVYLLAKDNEDRLNYVGNILAEKGFEGYYMDRYLTDIYDKEMRGNIKNFTDWLNARYYLEYCKDHSYDDRTEEIKTWPCYSDRSAKHIWMHKD